MVRKVKPDLMARVLKGSKRGSNRAAFIPVRVPDATKKNLQDAADKEGVSLNLYLQDLLQAKANGRANPDAIEEERGLSTEREIRRELVSSVASAGDIRQRLDGLRRLCRGMLADAERTLRAGRYSFWRGEPDEQTKKLVATLELELTACSKSVSEARAAILAARPGKPAAGQSLMDSIVGGK